MSARRARVGRAAWAGAAGASLAFVACSSSYGVAPDAATADECAADRPCGAGACVSGVCFTDATPCKALHAARPAMPSGVYEASTAASRIRVYCDMTSFGGGWMLVGRSAPEGKGSFGWRVAAGSVDDDATPYSLGLIGALAKAPFTEVLVGARGDGKAWGPYVYGLVVPADFLEAFRTTGTAPQDPKTMAGACDPPYGGPSMLAVLGLTETSDHFFISDQPATPNFGLWPARLDTNGAYATPSNMCSYTGELTGLQGMLFVR
jgi:hypothetical protein